MSRLASHAPLFSLVLALTATTAAQITDVTNTTSTPIPGAGHDYVKLLSETANPSNGSLSLRIQVPTPPGRRLSLPFAFAYDSNGVHHILSNGIGRASWWDNSAALAAGGWSDSIPMLSNVNIDIPGTIGPDCNYYNNYTFQDETGERHSLYLSVNADAVACSTFSIVNKLQGGDDHYHGVLTTNINGLLHVTDAHGNVYTFPCCALPYGGSAVLGANSTSGSALPSTIEDRNGNIITFSAGSGSITVNDTAGRDMLNLSGNTVTVAGLGGLYTTTGGTASSNYSAGGSLVYNSGSCDGGAIPQDIQTVNVITKITLPNGTFYSFSYDPTYGVLSKITYPNGGYVSYSYAVNALSEQATFEDSHGKGTCIWHYGAVAVAHRYVSFDGVNIALQQDFSYSTTWNSSYPYNWTSKSATVTTTDNVAGQSYATNYTYIPYNLPKQPNDKTQFGGQVPLENTIVYKDTNGATLRTITKSWVDQYELASEQTALENGQTSKTAYTYGPGAQVTEQDDYDYGSGAPGNLLRQIKKTYQSLASPIGGTIYDRPCKVVTYDGSNNQLAETDYTYDGGTTVCGTAGTPSVQDVVNLPAGTHDETNYSATSTGSRGNVTTKTQWLSGGTSPVTTYTYDKTGQVLSRTDPCGNSTCPDMPAVSSDTTTYSYANTGGDGTSNYTILSGGQNVSYTPSNTLNAYPTQITDALGHTSLFRYDFNNGQLTVSIDANKQRTSYLYSDLLSRPTLIGYPDGGQTEMSYSDTGPSPSVTICQDISGSAGAACSGTNPPSGWKTSTSTTDGLGHVVQAKLIDPDCSTGDTIATTYDGLGRVHTVSNPYCTTSDPTYGLTTYAHDPLGRTSSVTEPDGSAVTTVYSGNTTTVTDEAGRARKSVVDGLGRLTEVFEDPSGVNYESDYTYDALDNLFTVSQKGGTTNSANWRTRTFTYDSLSRLLCAANPEVQLVSCPVQPGTYPAGAITYAYDANGNVSTKTAPSPNQTSVGTTVTTTYKYDGLNRLIGKSYADSYPSNQSTTPPVQYGYDGIALSGCTQTLSNPPQDSFPVGRRTQMCEGSSSVPGPEVAYYTHDPMGRIATLQHKIAPSSNGYTFTYNYNLDGSINTETFPMTGDVHTYTYNGAARPTSLTDGAGHTNISSATYTPFGALDRRTRNASGSLTEKFYYNNRLQPAEIFALTSSTNILDICYDFHSATAVSTPPGCSFPASTTGDNGNVYQIVENTSSPIQYPHRSESFVYDSLNRISTARSQTLDIPPVPIWNETYTIDAWGNMYNRSGNTTEQLTCAGGIGTTSQNQFPPACRYQYDAAGNMIHDAGLQYVYDDENRIVQDGSYQYFYDGDGNRVARCTSASVSGGLCTVNPSAGTLYWRGISGEAELTATVDATPTWRAEFSFFGGRRIARLQQSDSSVHYYFADQLGSTSVAYSNGAYTEDLDYYPYGGISPNNYSTSPEGNFLFTGKERDTESGLDNFGARYDASSLGRFMTPDSASYSNRKNPQSWNLYAYALNNPVTFGDVDGHKIDCANNIEQCKKDAAGATGNAEAAKRVTTETKTHGWWIFKWTETSIKITGDINSFRALSANASKLADLVTSKDTITVSYGQYGQPGFWANPVRLDGGSFSVTPSERYDPQAFIDPSRNYDEPYDTDAVAQHIPQANTAEEFGHEVLGHIWGEMFGGHPAMINRHASRANMRDSIIGENAVRALDPARGQKGLESHHNYNDSDTVP